MTQPRTLLEENQMLRQQVADLEQTVNDMRTAPDEQLVRLAKRFGFSKTKCKILVLMSDGNFHTRREILGKVGGRSIDAESIKVHMSQMRKLLQIEGRYSFGYRLLGDALTLVQKVMAGLQ